MRNFKLVVGLAAIACVFGVAASSAYASEFESRFGNEKIMGKQIGTEEFVVYPMTVVCNKAISTGETTPGLKPTFKIKTTYSTCTTLAGAIKATVSPAEWEYLAEKEGKKNEGQIKLVNEVVIKPAIGTACFISIPPQETHTMESVLYEDGTLAPTGKAGPFKTEGQQKLSAYSKFSGLMYTATGWPCTGPKSAAELREMRSETSEGEGGKYVGATKLELFGGDLTWKEF